MGMHYGSRTADRLTDRQREILALIAHGCTNGQIAERLGITLDGAKWHVSEIMAKLGASSREEAVAAWQAERAPRARIARAARWAGATLFTNQAAGIIAGVTVAAVVIAAVVVMVAASNGGNDSNPAAVTSPTSGTTSTPATSATAAASPSNTAAAVPSPAVTIPGPLVPPASLTKFEMLDGNNGWAFDAGSAGSHFILRTADGGHSWHNVSPIPDQDKTINQAFFLDRDHAWALVSTRSNGGQEVVPRIFRTSDGGATWQASDPFAGTIPEGSLTFSDAKNGWYFQDLGAGAGSQGIAIYRTTDSGATWARVGQTSGGVGSPGPNLPLSCIKSQPLQLTATTGFATASCAGGPPFLYRTINGGADWILVTLPDPADGSTPLTSCLCNMSTPVFPTRTDGFVLMSGEHRGIYVTHDAGATWNALPSPIGQPNGVVALSFSDAQHGWLFDPSTLYTSTDGGSSWTSPGPLPFQDALFTFISPAEGFAWARAPGQGGSTTAALFHTTDGGKTWVPVR